MLFDRGQEDRRTRLIEPGSPDLHGRRGLSLIPEDLAELEVRRHEGGVRSCDPSKRVERVLLLSVACGHAGHLVPDADAVPVLRLQLVRGLLDLILDETLELP